MEKLFRILKVSEDFVSRIETETIVPHLHDFEELIIITEGGLEHFVDFTVEEVNAPAVCYISMGKTHKLLPKSDLRGWVINYKNEFVPESNLHFYSNFLTSASIPMQEGACLNRYTSLCEIINAEYVLEQPDLTTIRHLLQALISMIEAERKRNIPVDNASKATQITTFNSFLKILEDNFRRDEGVSFYANKMNMTERNLNIICRNNFQKSVSEIIETRKLIEAKQLLLHSEKTISEIGFDIGYNEKSYFTRVFHNKLGITPSRFRELSQSYIA